MLKFRKTSCNRIKISARLKSELCTWSVFNETRWRSLTFPRNFKSSAWAETSHVIATKFQPGVRAAILAWAEIPHVITPNKVAGLKGFLPYKNDCMSFISGQNKVDVRSEVTIFMGGQIKAGLHCSR